MLGAMEASISKAMSGVKDPRAIVNRARLTAEIAGLAEDAANEQGLRAAVLATLKQQLSAGQAARLDVAPGSGRERAFREVQYAAERVFGQRAESPVAAQAGAVYSVPPEVRVVTGDPDTVMAASLSCDFNSRSTVFRPPAS